jgi:superkiller protein 3
MAKGYIFEHSGRWKEASQLFDKALHQDNLPTNKRIEAREERAWSLVNAGQLDEGEAELREVIVMREEQDEETQEADDAAARLWWRLGKCLWDKGGKFFYAGTCEVGTLSDVVL